MSKILWIGFFSFISVLGAAKPSVRLKLDQRQIGINESARLTLIIENAQKVSEVQIMGRENFELSSPNISQRSSFGLGQNSSLYQLEYALSPKKQGSFKLRAQVVSNEGTLSSNIVEIQVGGEKKHQAADLDAMNPGPSGVMPQTKVAKTQVYVGEPFVLEYQLFSNEYEIQKFGYVKGRVFQDFFKLYETREDFEGRWSSINGQRYIYYDAGKNVLVADKSGTKSIPPQELRMIVYQVFNYRNIDITLPGKQITVLPLPAEGKPANFSGLAGKLKLDVESSSPKIQYGEAVTLKVKISGTANLNLLSKLVREIPEDLKIYEYPKDTYEEIQGDTYNVERSYDVIMIPKKSGQVTFPGIKVPYFNVAAKKYDELVIPAFTMEVEGGPQETTTQEAEVKVIALNKPLASKENSDYWQPLISKSVFWNLLALILLLIAGVFSYRYWRPFQKTPRRQLKNLYQRYCKKKIELDEEALLYQMVEIALSIKLQSVDLESIRQTSLPSELAQELLTCLNYLENSKFGVVEGEIVWAEKIKGIYEGLLNFLEEKKK